jgi:hypothetical protein
MKKASASASRGSEAKGSAVPKTVDEYLATIPEPARSTLNKVRAAIRSVVPAGATEVISYRIPAFKIEGPKYTGARLVRRIFGPLQLVPHRIRDKSVQERTSELPDIERHHPVPGGQTSTHRLGKENGEGPPRGERTQAVSIGRRITVAKDNRAGCGVYPFIPIDNFLPRRIVEWFS